VKNCGRKLRAPYGPTKPGYHSRDKGIPHYRNLTALGKDTWYTIQKAYLGMVAYNDWIFGQVRTMLLLLLLLLPLLLVAVMVVLPVAVVVVLLLLWLTRTGSSGSSWTGLTRSRS